MVIQVTEGFPLASILQIQRSVSTRTPRWFDGLRRPARWRESNAGQFKNADDHPGETATQLIFDGVSHLNTL
jgi:hypothetical protein